VSNATVLALSLPCLWAKASSLSCPVLSSADDYDFGFLADQSSRDCRDGSHNHDMLEWEGHENETKLKRC